MFNHRAVRVAFLNVNAKVTGGAEESLALLLRHLPFSVDPVVVCFEAGPFVERLRGYGIDVRILPLSGGVRHTRREGSWIRGGLSAPSDVARLMRLLEAVAPDLIHTDTMKGHVLGSAAGRMLRVPTMLHVRDMFEGNARTLLRLLAKSATDYVSVSRAVARWYGLSVAKVIHNPLDLDRYRALPSKGEARAMLSLPQDVPIVGMVGRINRWKGHERFLRIIAEVSKKVPVHAVIVGEPRFRDYDLVAQLEGQVSDLGLRGRVSFLPWMDDPRPAYRALDVHANCSVREPFGRSILEAAACGIPSVCFDDGAFGELFEEGDIGRAVPVARDADFASALIAMIGRKPTSAVIIKRIERFSSGVHATEMAQRMQEIVDRKRTFKV